MKTVPDDVQVLARDLGVSAKKLRRLRQEHGDRLVKELQKRWRKNCREHPRFLAGAPVVKTEKNRQSLLDTPQELGYSGTTFGAVDTLEALSKEDQKVQSDKARDDFDKYRAKHRPSEVLAQDLKRKSNRIRKLKAEAIQAGVDVRAEYDGFIARLEDKLSAASDTTVEVAA